MFLFYLWLLLNIFMQMNFFLSIASLVVSTLSLYFFQKQFVKKKIIDRIIDRSSHKTLATRSGGLSIFFTLFSISFISYLFNYELYNYSLLIPLSILMVVGLYDDLNNVDFKLKFIFQIIAAKILVDSGFLIDNMHGILGINDLNRIISQLLSIFIIVAIINAFNFIDGLDGLATSIITLFIILFETLSINSTPFINLSTVIIFSILPALFFNYKKNNKIFLGDSGSLFLGGLASIYIMYVLSNDYLILENFDINKIFFVLSIFIYPIIDLIRIVFNRFRKGLSPFKADRNHIHHYLIDKFHDHYKVVLIIIISSLVSFAIIHLLI